MVLDLDGGIIEIIDIFRYKKAATQNPEVAQKLKEYLKLEISEPGCRMMCSVIDTFMNKEFIHGLTLADKEYSAEYKVFYEQLHSLSRELDILAYEIEEQTGEELFGYSDDELKEIKNYLDTDKKYPYEGIGIEVEPSENVKREQLKDLVQTAINTQAELEQAQGLKESYDQLQNVQELKIKAQEIRDE